MKLGTITQLWRYPVKSMAGERLERALLSERGIPGDRGWAVFDESRGGVTSGKRLPLLRTCRASYPREPDAGAASPPAEIVLPDGTRVLADAADTARLLGERLGRPVTLRPLGPAGSEAAARLTLQDEPPEVARELMGVLPGEPMADLGELTPERLRVLRQGNFFDAYPVHLLTRTTLNTLARVAPESDWDERRFRANLLVAAEEPEGYPELGWIRRRLRVGEAVIEVAMGCPRCVMVTQAADELPQDHRLMRTLVRETKHTAGIYARVAQAGMVSVGDPVELL